MTTDEHTVNTHVTFALAPKPYVHKYPPKTTAAQVLADALAAFGVTADGTTRYYLLDDGTEVDPAATLGELTADEHGHKHEITLALRTETISG